MFLTTNQWYFGDTFELYPKLARCSPPEKKTSPLNSAHQ